MANEVELKCLVGDILSYVEIWKHDLSKDSSNLDKELSKLQGKIDEFWARSSSVSDRILEESKDRYSVLNNIKTDNLN